MGGFILTLILVAILNAVVGMISPDGDAKKYVRFLGSLCILCAIVSPIYSAVSGGELSFDGLFSALDGGENENYEEVYLDALSELSRESAQGALKAQISERFKISEELFDVVIEVENADEKCRISEVTLLLHSTFVSKDPRDILDFVGELTGARCTVIYD